MDPIGDFVVKILQPYNVVEAQSFHALLKVPHPKNIIPSRKSIATVIIKRYQIRMSIVKDRLKASK